MKLSKEELENIYGGGAGLILIGLGALCVLELLLKQAKNLKN